MTIFTIVHVLPFLFCCRCFILIFAALSRSSLGRSWPNFGRCSVMITVYEIVSQNLGTPRHKIWQLKNIKISVQFQATSRFDSKYLRNTYRQLENGFEIYDHSEHAVHTFRRPVHLSKLSYFRWGERMQDKPGRQRLSRNQQRICFFTVLHQLVWRSKWRDSGLSGGWRHC